MDEALIILVSTHNQTAQHADCHGHSTIRRKCCAPTLRWAARPSPPRSPGVCARKRPVSGNGCEAHLPTSPDQPHLPRSRRRPPHRCRHRRRHPHNRRRHRSPPHTVPVTWRSHPSQRCQTIPNQPNPLPDAAAATNESGRAPPQTSQPRSPHTEETRQRHQRPSPHAEEIRTRHQPTSSSEKGCVHTHATTTRTNRIHRNPATAARCTGTSARGRRRTGKRGVNGALKGT